MNKELEEALKWAEIWKPIPGFEQYQASNQGRRNNASRPEEGQRPMIERRGR